MLRLTDICQWLMETLRDWCCQFYALLFAVHHFVIFLQSSHRCHGPRATAWRRWCFRRRWSFSSVMQYLITIHCHTPICVVSRPRRIIHQSYSSFRSRTGSRATRWVFVSLVCVVAVLIIRSSSTNAFLKPVDLLVRPIPHCRCSSHQWQRSRGPSRLFWRFLTFCYLMVSTALGNVLVAMGVKSCRVALNLLVLIARPGRLRRMMRTIQDGRGGCSVTVAICKLTIRWRWRIFFALRASLRQLSFILGTDRTLFSIPMCCHAVVYLFRSILSIIGEDPSQWKSLRSTGRALFMAMGAIIVRPAIILICRALVRSCRVTTFTVTVLHGYWMRIFVCPCRRFRHRRYSFWVAYHDALRDGTYILTFPCFRCEPHTVHTERQLNE